MDSRLSSSSPGQDPNPQVNDSSSISINDILVALRKKWYLVALCLVLFVVGGFFYIQTSPKKYSRYASLLIQSKNDMNSALSRLSQFTGDKSAYTDKVSNQMIILGTERVVRETVERLHLDVSYSYRNNLRSENLYKQTPLRVDFINEDPQDEITISLSPIKDNAKEILVSGVRAKNPKFADYEAKVVMGDTLSTPIGRLVITPTPYFSNLKNIKTLTVTKSDLRKTVQSYVERLSINLQQKETSIIKLSIESTNATLAEDFLSTLIKVYNEFERADKIKIAENTQRFIDERLGIISNELGQVDNEIENFKQSQQIADIQAEAKQYIENSSEMNTRLVDLSNRLSVAQFVLEHLRDKEQQNKLIPVDVGITSPAIVTAISKYNEMLLDRDRLIMNSSDASPAVLDLDNQLAALRLSIIKSIDNLIAGLKVEKEGLLKESTSYQNRITSVPMQERIVGSIYRQQKIKEELYLFLLNVREQNALSIESAESDARLIQNPTGPLKPVSPRTSTILLASVLLGIALPLLYIYIRTLFNNKVQGKDDLTRFTTMPVVGEIPHYKATRSKRRKIGSASKKTQISNAGEKTKRTPEEEDIANLFVVERHQRNIVTEAFSVLRSNLSFMSTNGEPVKRIMVTSAIPDSGKTFISANLALSLCKAGMKVLLVDCDIRKNTLSRLTHLYGPTQRGLTNYLSNNNTYFQDILVRGTIHPNLTILPSGPIPPNPAELLMSESMKVFLSEQCDEFDMIVIDSIPVINLADARIINYLVDATLMVIRENHLPRTLLADLELMHKRNVLKNVSVVLNDAGITSSTYAYGYGYGSEPEE